MGEKKVNNIKCRKTWDLESLFEGGSGSCQLGEHIETLVTLVSELEVKVDCFHTPQKIDDSLEMAKLIESISLVKIYLSEANSFITCLLALNSKDQKAISLQGHVESINAKFDFVIYKLQKTIANTVTGV